MASALKARVLLFDEVCRALPAAAERTEVKRLLGWDAVEANEVRAGGVRGACRDAWYTVRSCLACAASR